MIIIVFWKVFSKRFSFFNFRKAETGPCKDVTLGDCTFKQDDISDIIFSPDASNCQSVCSIFADCFFFHFDRSKNALSVLIRTPNQKKNASFFDFLFIDPDQKKNPMFDPDQKPIPFFGCQSKIYVNFSDLDEKIIFLSR